MDSRLESLIMDTDWLIARTRGSAVDQDTLARQIERKVVQIDKILNLEPEILDDNRPMLENILLYGLQKGHARKRLLTHALSIGTQASKYHACTATIPVFNRLLHTFVHLHSAKKIEYIYELSCISRILQNMLLGNGLRAALDQPRQLTALLGICQRGFSYDTHEISPKLIMTILFKWPLPSGDKQKDDEYSGALEGFIRLIVTKLEVEDIENTQSRLYLLYSLVCAVDFAQERMRKIFIKIFGDEKAEKVFAVYMTKWLEISTDQNNLRPDLALISCRTLRRIIVTPASLRPRAFESMSHMLIAKSIYIIDNLINRLKELFSPSYDDNDYYILRLSPYDRLIPEMLYRFFTATRTPALSDEEWQRKLIDSIDEHSRRRLVRIVDFVVSRSSILVFSNGCIERRVLTPNPTHVWAEYIQQALSGARGRQTASVMFNIDKTNTAKRIKLSP